MNYVQKYLTRQNIYEHKYSNTHRISRIMCFQVHYVGNGGSEQEREGGESSVVESGHAGF
jgi:hypothetical protein